MSLIGCMQCGAVSFIVDMDIGCAIMTGIRSAPRGVILDRLVYVELP
jgi:hypothetical protein